MQKVREGDEMSFVLLLERHRTPVYRYFYRMTQNAGVAEELAQETFLRVYRARASWEPTAKFTTWLYRIATHLALNHLRDRRHEARNEPLFAEPGEAAPRQYATGEATAEEDLVHNARLAEIRAAVDALPEKQRAAVLMHKFEDMEYARIAKVLDCSESALKSLLFRAYESLRGRLRHFHRGQS
jgi:RNA polymerase sigma-70 factor, ECF subfamily